MRISRKIGISFFVTFLLVIILGALSIYSLRHIYRGLSQVFARDLPASRSTYQIAISMEKLLSEINNFLITGNENFKINYEKAHKGIEQDISSLTKFISEEEETGLFEEVEDLTAQINGAAQDIFKNRKDIDTLYKDLRAIEIKFTKKLDSLFDFEEKKIQDEKDFLLVQTQYLPASDLITEARLRFSKALSDLNEEDVLILEKSLRDYKNYYGYSLSDKERSLATELIESSTEIKSIVSSIIDLRAKAGSCVDLLLAKDKDFMEALDKIIALKKSGISSKLGAGAALTEDIPAIHNISKIEKDLAESWRASSRYILTGDETYIARYHQLRQNIDKALKDYGRHARLRDTEKFLDDIIESDNAILKLIDSNMALFDKKQSSLSEFLSIGLEIENKIDELLAQKDSLIKEAKDPQDILEKLVPARWILMHLKDGLSCSSRFIMDYLDEQELKYKDQYSESYFDMKKYMNRYRNLSKKRADSVFIKEIELQLDSFNSAVLGVIDSHDSIMKERGWTLIELQGDLKDRLAKAVEAEIGQIERNKKELTNRIRTINIVIFIIIGVVAFIAVFIIFYTTSSITNPIQELYSGAGIIGKGNLDHRLNIKTGDEIQDLAEGFNTMAGELKELYTNLENKVKERTAQLGEANKTLVFKKDELEKINSKLKELDRMKSDFVANVVHELRTPLTLITGNLDNIDKGFAGKVQPKQQEILGDVFRVVNRLARLVNNLLDLSKIESGKMSLKKETLNVVELAKGVLKEFDSVARKKKVDLKREFPDKAVSIKADEDKLTQVFVNLVGNALKFTDKGGVTVKIAELQDEVQVEIQDTGPGMTKEECEKIFDKFVRVVAEKKEGTGLGLPIAKDIVELHKGRMRVESTPGKGSTFIFNLPK